MRAVYCAYLLFQLWSHTYLFEDPDRNNRLAVKRPRLHQRLSQFRAQERNGESSTESSPGLRAAAPQGLGYKRCFPSASDISLPLASGTSSSLGYAYTRGTATPAPVLGSTVKLVRDGRCTVTSLPSGEELHTAPHIHLCDSANFEQVCDDESGTASGEKTAASDAPDEEKPQLSWTLTFSLLVFVTIVRLSLGLLCSDVLFAFSWLPSMRSPWSNPWINYPGPSARNG
jgi:Ca2+:H+ antiporter